jgi:hypothetical protein
VQCGQTLCFGRAVRRVRLRGKRSGGGHYAEIAR